MTRIGGCFYAINPPAMSLGAGKPFSILYVVVGSFSQSAWQSWLVSPEAESKEKHVVWDPMPELTINLTLMSTPESNSGALSSRAVGPGALSSKAMNPEL
jgi:hypothetical protein